MFVTRGIVSYGIVAEVTGPSYRPTSTYILCILPSGIPAGIPESGIPDHINLALERFNSDVCSHRIQKCRGILRILKNDARQEPE